MGTTAERKPGAKGRMVVRRRIQTRPREYKPGLALHHWVTMLPKRGKRLSWRREQREQRKASHTGCVVGSGTGVASGYFLRSEVGQP